MHQCKSAPAAQSYFTEGLTREGYYLDGQEVPGRWGGKAAFQLGLDAEPLGPNVSREGFIALSENRIPGTTDRLTLRTKKHRTVGYDLNFHAPKGVSLQHAMHQDERILAAFQRAVRLTMEEIESEAVTRVRKDGRYENRHTGNLVWAEFIHFTSRPSEKHNEPDPHLHAHCFTFNATYDQTEEAWKAGQFRNIMRDAPYFEAAFHVRFARRLRQIGYQVQRTQTGWDIAEIPRSLIDKYSSRTIEIEAFADEHGIYDPQDRARVGVRTRRAKQKSRRMKDLHGAWDERLSDEERTLLRRIDRNGRHGGTDDPPDPPESPDPPDPPDPTVAATRAIDWAIEHAFERRSSFRLKRLLGEAMRYSAGEVTVEDIWAASRAHPQLVTRDNDGDLWVTTRSVLSEEKAIVAFAADGKGVCAPARERLQERTGERDWICEARLGEDQRQAVDHVLDSKDRVMTIRGAAGVGKTTMMREAVDALKASGAATFIAAPTAQAARGEEGLRAKGFAGADTVAKLLSDPRTEEAMRSAKGRAVLWIDEAGLLGAKTMKRIFDLAETHNARVVLCGDARQHKSVERGDALRVLEKHAGITPAELVDIRRQSGAYREAVAALSIGDVDRGVDTLDRLGVFREIEKTQDRAKAAARDYVETLSEGRSAAVVSPTHAEGRRVASEIRALQRENGMLQGDDQACTRLRDLSWTEAERGDASRYEPGLVAHFHQHAKGVVAGDQCEILSTTRSETGALQVQARTPRGVEITLPIDKADRFQVYRKESMNLAVGDVVRITRNGRAADGETRLTNGSLYKVGGFTKHGAVVLDGVRKGLRRRTLPKNYGHLAYGSVSTSHAAQGRDVDRVIVVQSAESLAASNMDQFYVSISRGKQSLAIYTDDVDQLVEAVRRSGERKSGLEMMEEPTVHTRKAEPRSKADRTREQQRDRARRTAQDRAKTSPQQPQPPRDKSKPSPQRRPAQPERPAPTTRSRPSRKDQPGRERYRDR